MYESSSTFSIKSSSPLDAENHQNENLITGLPLRKEVKRKVDSIVSDVNLTAEMKILKVVHEVLELFANTASNCQVQGKSMPSQKPARLITRGQNNDFYQT